MHLDLLLLGGIRPASRECPLVLHGISHVPHGPAMKLDALQREERGDRVKWRRWALNAHGPLRPTNAAPPRFNPRDVEIDLHCHDKKFGSGDWAVENFCAGELLDIFLGNRIPRARARHQICPNAANLLERCGVQ
eukprot:3728813-Pyramimonas_sp.AAC.1